MASTHKPLPPGFLDAARLRIPRLEPFPAFQVDAFPEEDWLAEADDGTGLEFAEFDFDEIAILY